MKRLALLFLIAAATFPASAAAIVPQRSLALPTDEVWAIIAGALAPIVSYVLNYLGPHVSEKAKSVVQLVIAAIAGGIAQAITAGGVGFNGRTLQFVVFAIIAAFAAHAGIYTRGTWAQSLGAGRNANSRPMPRVTK